jgi:hypothetical protein
MRLYKFVTAERIDDILKGWIRFTQPGAFNDPFEIPAMKMAEIEERPSGFFDAVTDQTRELQDEFAANPLRVPDAAWKTPMDFLRPREGDQGLDLTEEERDILVEKGKKTIEEIDEKYCILSLSQSRENFLLWAHYADEHRGAVLEIEIDDSEFSNTYEAKGGSENRGEIKYVRNRPRLSLKDDVLMAHLFNKSFHWEYEVEYRVVRDLTHADKIIENKPDYDICLFRLPLRCLRSITFGVRFDRKLRGKLARRIKGSSKLRHIDMEQTKLDPQRFGLEFESV